MRYTEASLNRLGVHWTFSVPTKIFFFFDIIFLPLLFQSLFSYSIWKMFNNTVSDFVGENRENGMVGCFVRSCSILGINTLRYSSKMVKYNLSVSIKVVLDPREMRESKKLFLCDLDVLQDEFITNSLSIK